MNITYYSRPYPDGRLAPIDAPLCKAMAPAQKGGALVLHCTREDGHDDRHEACGVGGPMYASWTD